MILVVALASLLLGGIAAAVLGNPLWILVAVIVGAIVAIRSGYRHQGRAIRAELDRPPAAAPAASSPRVIERLGELDRLRASGTVDDEEYAAARARILGDL